MLAILFSSQKQPPLQLSPASIDTKSALMQALAEVEEVEQQDDGVIEISSDEEYNGWYHYVPKFLDIYLYFITVKIA